MAAKPRGSGRYEGAWDARQALASHAIHAALSRRHSRPGGVRPYALPPHGPPRPGQRRQPDGTTGTARTEPDPTAGRNKKQHPPQAGSLQGAGMRATASVTHRARRAAEPLARSGAGEPRTGRRGLRHHCLPIVAPCAKVNVEARQPVANPAPVRTVFKGYDHL